MNDYETGVRILDIIAEAISERLGNIQIPESIWAKYRKAKDGEGKYLWRINFKGKSIIGGIPVDIIPDSSETIRFSAFPETKYELARICPTCGAWRTCGVKKADD